MAYINIAEWSPDQVADWLKGLNGVIAPYISLFLAKSIKGQQLLFLRTDDLNTLGIHTIGHQELILEAVEHLRNFHYELDRENLQQLAMRLSCVATSLYNELRQHQDNNKVDTQTLSDVAHIIAAVKPLVCWLDRSPFMEQLEYSERKSALLKLSLEAATCAQRERFAERPTHAIAAACRQLAALADYIIQDVSDPMVLQPSSLDLVVLKKKDNHLGFDIVPSFSGHHQIANIKFGSPAHASGKIEEGDEIVQVNYQTVIGWCPKSARLACINERLNNASTIATQNNDLVLTLRRRPAARATVLAAPQFRPYRPIKRNWAGITGNTLMPNRVRMWDKDMLALRFRVPSVEPEREAEAGGDSSSDESEVLSPPSSPTTLDQMSSPKRLYLPKPRTLVQRRNTISGSSPISKRPNVSIEQFWQELENHKSLNHTGSAQMSNAHDHDEISNNLKTRPDKAISCSTFLEFTPRPKTCLGVRLNHTTDDQTQPTSNKCNKPFNNFNFDGIPAANHDQTENVKEHLGTDLRIDLNKSRGKLDKSHSTPAYDFGNNVNDEGESLVTQVIPESPTTPTESPTIIVHSAEKVDQILDFKKSSNQIGEAILLHHSKHDKVKTNLTEVNKTKLMSEYDDKLEVDSEHLIDILKPSIEVVAVFETVNIAMLQCSKEDGTRKASQFSPKSQSIFYTEFGDKSSNLHTQNVRNIQNELVEAINERCFVAPILVPTKAKISDLPPEPPPRPLSTQKPGFTTRDSHMPIKESRMRHIKKQDIQVVPNVDMNPPIVPTRRDIPLPISPSTSMTLGQISQLSYDMKHANSNLSHSDLSTPKTPLMQARSLQKLEVDNKTVHSPPKLDFSNIKPSQFDTSKMMSPTNSVVRGIFPSAKSKSLKKKNSILAKRRKVSVKEVTPGEMHGWLYQRCRTKSTSAAWRQKWYILTSNTLYGYKNKEATRADCLIFLNGFTVSPAQEVKSKPFSFKVYHTGTVFYFAAESADAMNMWYEYISRATLLNYDSWERAHKKDAKTDESKHFSETDYSDEDFFQDSDKSKQAENKNEKSKFGSLKKFTNRIHKTESQESVSHASTSLDRKYLRIFSSKYGSNKSKDEKLKSKHSDPVPTEQYRSYRKIPTSPQHVPANVGYSASPTKLPHENKDVAQNVAKIKKLVSVDNKNTNITSNITSNVLKKQQKKKPKPINYIHASNPNLLDFEKIDFIAKPSMNAPSFKPKIPRSENVMGFVTLEQFMLKKQEEERRQVFSNRVLMGIEKDSRAEEKGSSAKSTRDTNNLQKQLDKIVPDVIYGEIPHFNDNCLPTATGDQIQSRSLPKTPDALGAQDNNIITATHHEYVHIPDDIKTTNTQKNLNDNNSKPISIKGKDGYEKIVYGVSANDIICNENDNLESFSPLPRKPSFNKKKECESARHEAEVQSESSEFGLKSSSEFRLDSEQKTHIETKSLFSDFLSDTGASSRNISPSESCKDLGYETIYGEKCDDSVSKFSGTDEIGGTLPPKIMPKSKQVLNRQNSLTSSIKSGPDTNPVFLQGESPEKFWLNSLRRNDKVFSTTNTDNGTARNEKFFTKRTEPSAFMKSSEATIVKSDKAHKAACVGEHSKQLKSAAQYKPMSLPFVSPNKSLKTSPQFELMLDAKVMPVASGISRLRQIFQHSGASNKSSRTTSPTGSVKEKTILGSPRLHRTIFRKQHGSFHQPADGWTQDLTYSKAPTSSIASPDSGSEPSDTVLDATSSPGSCDVSSMSNMSTPDYPHLEYPPVFEPEIYCLSDPNTSFNLLSKKSNQFERE